MLFIRRNINLFTLPWKSYFGKFFSSGFSWLVILLIIYFYGFKYIEADMFNRKEIIRVDVISYYNYLPATFAYHDLTFNSPQLKDYMNRMPDGRKLNKMTVGMSYFYAPFYLATYAFFKYNHYNIDVYSPMFQFAIGLSGLLAALLAMIVIRSNLRRFFSDFVTSLCLILIFMGSNAYYYGVYEGAFTHIHNLFLISLLINLTFSWYKNPSVLFSILLGLIAGWIILIRPVNMVFCLFPILYGTESFKTRMIFWKKQWMKIVLMLLFAFIICIPQLLYWKFVSGHYIFYSYTGEKFFWLQPEIFRGFFSYRNGWLVYSPLMALSLIGLFFLYRTQKKLFLPVIILFVLNTYVIYCWWCWWYVGFGSRAIVDSYAILAFPLGALFTWMMNVKKILISFTVVIASLLIYLNIFQSWQKDKGLIHWDGMTKELYWAHFLKEKFDPNCDKMEKRPDYKCSLVKRCD